MARRMSVKDQSFFILDQPSNPQVVNGLMWFDEEPEWDAVLATLQERLVDRFPLFSHRAVHVEGRWVWQEDSEFSLSNHVRRTALPAPGDEITAQDYVAARFSEMIDRGQPLWSVELLTGFTGFGGRHGALIVSRVHHAIADGVRIVQVLLGLCDHLEEGSTPGAVGRVRDRPSAAQHAGRLVSDVAEGGIDIAAGLGQAALRMPARVRPGSLSRASRLARSLRPADVVHAVSDLAEEDNYVVNTGRSLGRLAVTGRSAKTVWSGRPGEQKRISWLTEFDVEVVRTIGRSHGVTINDVCIGLVSRALTDHLQEKGETRIDELNWFVPVSLKPIDADIPPDLGDHFTVVMPPIPLGVTDPGELFSTINARMNRIKHSAEPAIGYGIGQLIGLTPPAVSARVTSLVASKTVGIMTNVPGPRTPLGFAGKEVKGMLGFGPTVSGQPIGVAIFSYNGGISVGVITDAGLIPDPERITAGISAHYRDLAAGTAAVRAGA